MYLFLINFATDFRCKIYIKKNVNFAAITSVA